MKKVKTIFIAIGIFVLIILIIIFGTVFILVKKYSQKGVSDDTGNTYLNRAKEITGLNLDHGEVIKFLDSKGGFFGEGDVLLEIQYSNEDFKDIEEQISTRKYWKELPMKKKLREYLMGLDFEFPQCGHYLFYDRHSEADSHYDYKEMTKRPSIDFSVLISDSDAKKLFISKEIRREWFPYGDHSHTVILQ